MEKYKSFFTKHYNLIKKNYKIILFLPTFLGGLWQVFELSSISTAFIRFFSFSQLVSDGILIIFVLLTIYFALVLGGLFSKSDSEKNSKTVETNKSEDTSIEDVEKLFVENQEKLVVIREEMKGLIKKGFIGIILFIISTYSLFQFEVMQFGDSVGLSELFFILFYFSFWSRLLIHAMKNIAKGLFFFRHKEILDFAKNILNEDSGARKKAESILLALASFLVPLILAGCFVFVVSAVDKFRKSYVFPKNLYNIELIECALFQQLKLSHQSDDILYFNDKYIFIGDSSDSKNSSIFILEFKSLFDFKSCEDSDIKVQQFNYSRGLSNVITINPLNNLSKHRN